ncbi:protein PHLOEM PROTEIN 2-LIKE A9 [Citrus sinensis]|uniref:protein PHLOEM PROTEIN 2-LIKE A9 n=1 Tax=Citrus sinensis TaxID=2711 RepID=UPI002279CC5B|nr:protein PHLOEM PROTEIN 2-LIKE A9 [Citrus sinensis]
MSSKKPHHEAEQEAMEWNAERTEAAIKSRGLNIVWGNDPRYWHLPEKRSNDPVELVQVCWLEATGSVEVKRGKKYQIGFKISLKADAFGWSGCPVFMMAKLGKKGKYTWRKMKPLDHLGKEAAEIPDEKFEILVPEQGENQLYFGLYEVWNGKWKGGLLIHHAFIREVK